MRVVFSFTIILVVLLRATLQSEENDINFNINSFESALIANNGKDDTIDKNIAEDSKLDTPELLTKYGYNAETHSVTTEDGYILRLHRIAGGPTSPPRPGKKVVFHMHGILDSSATIILSGPGRALGYLLADNDYDVWLGNSRGNVYSTDHVSFNPHGSRKERRNFWSHSFHEIGYYDLPASIDFILGKTNQTKLQYIGHSQGAAAFFVMASQRPEYNDKIEMMHALAPAVFLSHCKSPIVRAYVPFQKYLNKWNKLIGLYYFSPPKWLKRWASRTVCTSPKTQFICKSLIFLLAGWNSDQMNKTMVPLIMAHYAAGASTKSLVHLGQEVKSGQFRQFDYGWFKNLIKYKRTSPPEYNLKNVKAPVTVYYSQNDWLAAFEDVQKLLPMLPNLKKTYLVPHEKFNHMDFLWGTHAPELVYKEIIETMKSSVTKP